MRNSFSRNSVARHLLALAALGCAIPAFAQQRQTPAPQQPAPQQPSLEAPGTAQPEPEAAKPATPKPAAKPKVKAVDDLNAGRTVEEIIARVNNEIITKSEYDRALSTAEEDAKADCQNRCTAEQLANETEDRRKNALRDLIDQSLLVQRAKDLGTSVEPGVINLDVTKQVSHRE